MLEVLVAVVEVQELQVVMLYQMVVVQVVME